MSIALAPAGHTTAEIPRVLHQIYFGGIDAASPAYRDYAQTWRVHHPHWQHQFWDAARCRNLVEEHYGWFLPVYDAYRHRIQRVDAVRYFILHHHGGVYADMDIESRRPIDELLAGRELLLSGLSMGVTNAVMGSTPGHPLWPRVFAAMQRRRNRFALSSPLSSKLAMPMYVGYSTGPLMLSDCVAEGGYYGDPRVGICPTHYFEPLAPGGNGALREGAAADLSGSYAIHHMSMHWMPRSQKVLGWILDAWAKTFVRKQQGGG
jgi:hypothetical protein